MKYILTLILLLSTYIGFSQVKDIQLLQINSSWNLKNDIPRGDLPQKYMVHRIRIDHATIEDQGPNFKESFAGKPLPILILYIDGKIFQGGLGDICSFQATMTGGGSVAHDTYTTVPYNNQSYDEGSDYNNSTYMFTAPCNGIYLFAASFLWANTSNWDAGDNPIISFSVDGTTGSHQRVMHRTGNYTEYFSMNTTAIIKLDSGDTVNVEAYQNTDTTLDFYDGGGESYYNQFQGTLLHALT